MMRCSSDPDIVPSRSINTSGTLQAVEGSRASTHASRGIWVSSLLKYRFVFQNANVQKTLCLSANELGIRESGGTKLLPIKHLITLS